MIASLNCSNISSRRCRITKSSIKNLVGHEGFLFTDLKCFHANAGIYSMDEVLAINDETPCIGVLSDQVAVWWTKNSDFTIEIEEI